MVGGFFPTPYPDECLYSILCRYYVRSGGTSYLYTTKELFGNIQNLALSIFFPMRLECVDNWASPTSGITRNNIAINHTMYPYFAITYEPDFRKEIELIINGGTPADTHNYKGLKGFRFLPSHLRYCPLCAKDEKSAYGEPYWHRSHQLPGSVYCMKHCVRLIDSNVLIRHTARHFHPASNEIGMDFAVDAHDDLAPYKNELLKIGKESEWLLNNGLIVESQVNGREKYCRMLRESGLASVKGACDYEALDAAFNAFWGKDFLNILFQETLNFKGWMYQIQEIKMRSYSPLHYILLMCFLKGSVKEFIGSEPSNSPFGKRSFSCENPICPHYHINDIVNMETQYFGGGVKGIFQCTYCGMRYRFVISQKASGTPVIIDYGHLWINELKRCVSEGISLSETAKILKCSKDALMYRKKKLGLVRSLPYDQTTGAMEYYKSQIISFCKKYGKVSPTLVRSQIPNAYGYLFRHDYEWLRKHLVYEKDLDNERDLQLLNKVKDAVVKIKADKDIVRRLSIGYIADIAGVTRSELSYLKRKPLTQAFLESVVESKEDWLRR